MFPIFCCWHQTATEDSDTLQDEDDADQDATNCSMLKTEFLTLMAIYSQMPSMPSKQNFIQ